MELIIIQFHLTCKAKNSSSDNLSKSSAAISRCICICRNDGLFRGLACLSKIEIYKCACWLNICRVVWTLKNIQAFKHRQTRSYSPTLFHQQLETRWKGLGAREEYGVTGHSPHHGRRVDVSIGNFWSKELPEDHSKWPWKHWHCNVIIEH